MICIYKITSPTGRIYVGQTVNLLARKNHYKNLHFKKQKRLYASVIKHGWENHTFEVLENCSVSVLNEKERFYQDLFNVIGENGLNLRLTKSDDKSGYLSEYSKNKISLKNKGIGNGMFGKKIKESSKNLQRNGLCGEKNYLSKWLLNTETGIFYPCLNEAGISINMEKIKLWQNIKINKKNRTKFIYV